MPDFLKKLAGKLAQNDEAPFCSAVVLAAGSSVRMGSDKILARLGELPVLARTLSPFQESEWIREIVVWRCVHRWKWRKIGIKSKIGAEAAQMAYLRWCRKNLE